MFGQFIWKHCQNLGLCGSILEHFEYEHNKIGIHFDLIFSISKQNFDNLALKLWFLKMSGCFPKNVRELGSQVPNFLRVWPGFKMVPVLQSILLVSGLGYVSLPLQPFWWRVLPLLQEYKKYLHECPLLWCSLQQWTPRAPEHQPSSTGCFGGAQIGEGWLLESLAG